MTVHCHGVGVALEYHSVLALVKTPLQGPAVLLPALLSLPQLLTPPHKFLFAVPNPQGPGIEDTRGSHGSCYPPTQ